MNERENLMENNKADFQILGQKIIFPMNVWASVTIAIIAILVGAIVYMVTTPEVIRAIQDFTFGNYDKHGVLQNKKEQKILGFWTPSRETRMAEDLRDLPDSKVPKRYFVDEKETQIIEFGKQLKKLGAQGYTRYKVFGEGTTDLKQGWFWQVTVDVDNEKFTRKNFLRFYSEFWGREKNIYLEEQYISRTLRIR